MNDSSDVYISKTRLVNYLEGQLDLCRYCLQYDTGTDLTDEQLGAAEAVLQDVIQKVNEQPVLIQTSFGISRSGLAGDKRKEPSPYPSKNEN
ncbi:MAG: hypothetical protein LUC47_08255 [Clostridiales bacterium]|nr:hypothetical protein [Clostridiales bacterium]